MIPVMWHPHKSFWDTALPEWIFEQVGPKLFVKEPNGGLFDVEGLTQYSNINLDRVVIVIAGRHSTGDYDKLNQCAQQFRRVVFFIIGDEEGVFDSSQLLHPNCRIWWAMPPFHPQQKIDRRLPNGWPTDAPAMIQAALLHAPKERPYDWNFMGQLTHSRRIFCVSATQRIIHDHPHKLLTTEGFSQGVSREEYYAALVRSKIVLCPAGPRTPDSFRFAEALEAGCIPFADNLTQDPAYPAGYWRYVFPTGQDFPFPVINSWDILPDLLPHYLKDWARRAREVQAWWEARKREYVQWIEEDLA